MSEPHLKEIILRNLDMSKASMEALCELLAQNQKLTKVDISNNLITAKYVEQI